jgi:hypothetical protein
MTLAVIAFFVAVTALVLVGMAGPLFRFGVLPLVAAFAVLGVGALLGIAAATVGLSVAGAALGRGQPLPQAAAGTVVIGLIAFAFPFSRVFAAATRPPIHDISTDVNDPPAFTALLRLRQHAANSLEFSDAAAAQQRRAYPDITSVRTPGPADVVFARALRAARGEGWEVVDADQREGRIEATDTTRWFGFKDDIVVRLTPEGAHTRVDVRSVSRVGRGDLGMNAARIRRYLARLRAI